VPVLKDFSLESTSIRLTLVSLAATFRTVPAAVSGIGRGASSPNARRWIVRAIALAATLLVSALASAPARADDSVGTVPPPPVGSLPTSYGDATAPPQNSQSAPNTSQSNTATNTQSATATGGAGGSATGGNAGPSRFADDGSRGGSFGGDAYANGGRAESHNSLENQQSNQISGRDSSGSRSSGGGKYYSDGQGTFVPQSTRRRASDRAAARTKSARPVGHFESSTSDRGIRLEAKERRSHATAKTSPLGGGLPGHGGQLPSQNPFFSLLSGSGGAGTGLLLLLLAVLGASIALPNRRFKAFRTPTGPWRPLAYVPPIELPG
jgi:hypothetical protein